MTFKHFHGEKKLFKKMLPHVYGLKPLFHMTNHPNRLGYITDPRQLLHARGRSDVSSNDVHAKSIEKSRLSVGVNTRVSDSVAL